MKRALFVYTRNEPDMRVSGEAKKMLMQVDAIKHYGIDCDLIYHNHISRFNKIQIRIPFIPIYNKKFRDDLLSKASNYDAIYIRKYIFDSSFVSLVKELHKKTKVIVEIPTYPYDLEWSQFVDLPMLLRDRSGRKKLIGSVDRFVTFSGDSEIFGVPCINTSNGIDISKISKRIPRKKKEPKINLVGVANVEKWHGFDRIINGLHDYYQDGGTIDICFHIVGGGAVIPDLKGLVTGLDLNNHVVFHGPMYGDDLNGMFNRCDIGVGSFGMFRIGLNDGYTLKLREYSARGIPFIYAYNDSLIEKNRVPYCKKFSNDNTPININQIINFYDEISKEDSGVVSDTLRGYAQKYMTWDRQMEPVAQYIIGG